MAPDIAPDIAPEPESVQEPAPKHAPDGTRDWRDAATRATRASLQRAMTIWPGLDLPAQIEVGFRLCGHAAGTASHKPPAIQYNATLLEKYKSDFIDSIVPHEVAHLVVHALYKKRVKPHGREWKEVVVRLGGRPDATHEFETSAARRLRRYYYECGCEALHPFIAKSHRRARNGAVRYTCRKCKERLRFTGIEGYE